jgi:hypothetical protein
MHMPFYHNQSACANISAPDDGLKQPACSSKSKSAAAASLHSSSESEIVLGITQK